MMESAGDILKRLDITRSVAGNGPPGVVNEGPDGDGDVCAVCGGRGWFTRNVPVGHPEFGQLITCDCQRDRLEGERYARLLRYSNLGYLSRFTFETLEPQGQADDPESRKLFQQACESALTYADDPSGWLVFTGPNGSGKTHLAAAITNRSIERGRAAFFVHVPDLLDHLRAAFAPTSDVSYNELFERVKTAPLLVLDGLETQSTTPWAGEKLQQLINHRYDAQLPTVFTAAGELSEFDPYTRSRLETEGLSRVLPVRRAEPAPAQRLGRLEPELARRMTFETFDVRGNSSTAAQQASLDGAFKAARNFAADPDGWLTLFSDATGVGKTHLAVAIAVERTEQGHPVFFAFVPELLDYLRYTFTPESRVTYDTVFDEVKNTPLLILDDLGREHSSPWAEEKLYQIVVHRHNARLATVITSALEFTEQTGPISSRVRDPYIGQLVRIDAPDYRIQGRRRGRRSVRQGERGSAARD